MVTDGRKLWPGTPAGGGGLLPLSRQDPASGSVILHQLPYTSVPTAFYKNTTPLSSHSEWSIKLSNPFSKHTTQTEKALKTRPFKEVENSKQEGEKKGG